MPAAGSVRARVLAVNRTRLKTSIQRPERGRAFRKNSSAAAGKKLNVQKCGHEIPASARKIATEEAKPQSAPRPRPRAVRLAGFVLPRIAAVCNISTHGRSRIDNFTSHQIVVCCHKTAKRCATKQLAAALS